MTAVGAISYSLYLSHWPIIFFGRFFSATRPTIRSEYRSCWPRHSSSRPECIYLLSAGSFSLRKFRSANIWRTAAGFWSAILVLAAINHITFLSKGFPWRLPTQQLELGHLQDLPAWLETCMTSNITPVCRRSPRSWAYVTKFWAIPVAPCSTASRWSEEEVCQAPRNCGLQRLSQTNLPVIFAQRWEIYDDDTIQFEADPTHGLQPHQASFRQAAVGF